MRICVRYVRSPFCQNFDRKETHTTGSAQLIKGPGDRNSAYKLKHFLSSFFLLLYFPFSSLMFFSSIPLSSWSSIFSLFPSLLLFKFSLHYLYSSCIFMLLLSFTFPSVHIILILLFFVLIIYFSFSFVFPLLHFLLPLLFLSCLHCVLPLFLLLYPAAEWWWRCGCGNRCRRGNTRWRIFPFKETTFGLADLRSTGLEPTQHNEHWMIYSFRMGYVDVMY